MRRPIHDIDLMQLADGELDAAARAEVEQALAEEPARRDRIAGVEEVGELVKGHLELAADQVEPRLARMWGEIEKQIDLGTRRSVRAPVKAPVDPVSGLWARVTRWIDTYRGHVLTGALSAGAVAGVALMMRPAPKVGDRAQATRVVTVPAPIAVAPTPVTPDVVPVHQPAEIDTVDVPKGTSTVFTIPGDDGDETTVVWVTPDDTVKGL